MAHVEHYKMADVKRLANEWTRDEKYHDSDGRIKHDLTKYNYCMDDSTKSGGMKTRRARSLLGVVRTRMDEVPHSTRKDLNVLSDWVITCPQELKDDEQKRQRFFEVAYQFCTDRYGAENVMNGYVHMDETTPHMHVPVMPVVDGRISAKALFTKKELTSFHKELDKRCEDEFGIKGLVKNGRTKGNYTFRELKQRSEDAQELDARKAKLDAQEKKAHRIAMQNEKDRKELDALRSSLNAQEDALRRKADEIASRDEKSLKIASEALQLYEDAQHFALQEKEWMSSHEKEHVRRQQAAAEQQKQKAKNIRRRVPAQFQDVLNEYNQQRSDMGMEL